MIPNEKFSILVVDDDDSQRLATVLAIGQHINTISGVSESDRFIAKIDIEILSEPVRNANDIDRIACLFKDNALDLLVTDMNFHGVSEYGGLRLHRKIAELESGSDRQFWSIFVSRFSRGTTRTKVNNEIAEFRSGHWNVSDAVDLGRGEDWPLELASHCRVAIERLLLRRLVGEGRRRLNEPHPAPAVLWTGKRIPLGPSEAAQTLERTVANMLSPCDMPVLITGESGVGKEVVARAIHHSGPRCDGRFLPINCAGLQEGDLADTELFGYVPYAFSGASPRGMKGAFEVADGGTLFLDEVGLLPLKTQKKLLRTLQEKTIRRVGGTEEIGVDVRMISATNENVADVIERGDFRADIYYRLGVLTVAVPPLRERRDDLFSLSAVFIDQINDQNGKYWTRDAVQRMDCFLGDDVVEFLEGCDWPGNVRQLQAALCRAVMWAKSNGRRAIQLDDMKRALGAGPLSQASDGLSDREKRMAIDCLLSSVSPARKGSVESGEQAGSKEPLVTSMRTSKATLSTVSQLLRTAAETGRDDFNEGIASRDAGYERLESWRAVFRRLKDDHGVDVFPSFQWNMVTDELWNATVAFKAKLAEVRCKRSDNEEPRA